MIDSPIAIVFVLSLAGQYAYICLHVIKRDRFMIDLSNDTYSLSEFEQDREWPHSELQSINCENTSTDEKDTTHETGEALGESRIIGEVKLVDNDNEADKMPFYLKKNVLNKDSFDAFMKVDKPYLNADLKITDLVEMLHVNRTYISSFINREYGVNFSVFINKYRLLEYEMLKEKPEYINMSKSELAEVAGFNSYRSFQRTKKEISGSNKRVLKDFKILINF